MAKAKRMKESAFDSLAKDLTERAERIGSRQSEKQAVMNEFDKERKDFFLDRFQEKHFLQLSQE